MAPLTTSPPCPNLDAVSVLRAAVYTRVSTRRQVDEGLSLDEQKRRGVARIESEGWQLVEVFTDAGISGRKGRDERPQLQALMRRLDEVDVLVVASLSRLGRSNRHLQQIFAELEAKRVELVSLSEGISTTTAAGKLLRNVLASLAEFEADLIGERVGIGAQARAKSGRPHGKAPYGYRSKRGNLEIDTEQAQVVERIYRAAADGRSGRQIVRELNAQHIPAHSGGKWSPASVSKILRNPTYKGLIRFNGEELPGQHEPIIEAGLWAKVAAAQTSKSPTPRQARPGRAPSGPHLFTKGLLRCMNCQSAMLPRTEKRDGREEYRCRGRENNGPDFCAQTPIPREPLDRAAFAYFREVGLDVERTRKELADATTAATRDAAKQLRAATAQAKRTAAAVERVRADYKSGTITAAEWRELKSELEAEHVDAQTRLDAARDREAELIAAAPQSPDAERRVAERLNRIQRAVAGKITDAPGIEAAREAIGAAFEAF